MKSYLVDEIASSDVERTRVELQRRGLRSELEDLFWVPIPEDLLNETQLLHRECRPHVYALELTRESIKVEFFARSLKNMRCPCNGPLTLPQKQHAISCLDRLLDELGVRS